MSCEQVLHNRSLTTGDPAVMIHADLSPSPGAARQARALVASALSDSVGRLLTEDIVYDAQLVVSELVTNAVLHARTDLHLGITHDDHALIIAVTDGAPPGGSSASGDGMRLDPDLGESGRGMVIVATLADDFGWRPRTDMPGKIMWALFELTAP